ncbi:MAG: TM2 domain-containing protein [Clostridia bacterium]|nr:TM2 domain-containing protein [Clostridia bacterium]
MTPKNKWISFFLCLFLGALGIHKFYEGRVLLGIVYIFTGGLFGIGYIFDLFILFFKPNPYYP